MKLRIDCYSKEELSIKIIFSKDDPLPKNEATDLVLFTAYTLRQLSNLGDHPAAKALDGYLVSMEHYESILKGKVIWPSAKEFLSDLDYELYARLDENHQQFIATRQDVEATQQDFKATWKDVRSN